MSSVLHPVGPEDKGTYWRRRLVVVLVLVVVAALAVLGVRALTGSDDAAAQQPTKLDPSTVASGTTASPTGTPTGSPTGSPTASGTATGTATATDTASRTSGGACPAQSLSLTLTSDYSAYGPGKTVRLVLTVENTSQTTCSVEVGTAVRTFTASLDGRQVWSSADCQTQTASQVYDLEPGGRRAMPVTWSRQRSESGCPTGQPMVEPGNYTIDGSWNGVDAQPVTVALTS
ncbi:hypothetical protein [Kineococcus aurantiacus]|uniref:DUF7974 domain-containing protein n=1 Tax=Kineococcus aurantiacus TaxID=37633 RepID=A0A7Y9DKA8_9ACTN|nr:hypothetical protein [Kineococcus aurantiacus]NYD22141.1 hypothetical protein [Kineococcus aurantiacus]